MKKHQPDKQGSNPLVIVGSGPGSAAHLTQAAIHAIAKADTLVGYDLYLQQLGPLASGKQLVSSGMTREIDRCREALRLTRAGHAVALISGGDAGIYGMAGLVLELLSSEGDTDTDVEVIPGLSAFQAAASRLGAPLMHDTALISLSDLLTPWEKIRKRVQAAAEADFVIAIYNPKSTRRITQLLEAQQIILASRPASTPIGIVRNACRDNEELLVTTLGELPEQQVDMATVLIIGNSATFVDKRGRMITPRGYEQKAEFEQPGEQPGSVTAAASSAPSKPMALMVVGTASDVGKSAITAGICRLLLRKGLSVAPFKSQNMALNAAVTPEGGEIGRAQAVQAQACGIPPHTDMNPVLLKPTTDIGSQVIVQGRPVGNMSVTEYDRFKPEAFRSITESYARLKKQYDFIVIEGAGSIAEINLKDRDIANLSVARMAGNCPAILVADIDRGGVFAQVVGSIMLLEPWERALIKGVIINKFRGDATILEPGLRYIEERCNIPVLGVIPWLSHMNLPAEDSLALPPATDRVSPRNDRLCIGIVKLPRISNFTDFDPLLNEPDVELCYLDKPCDLDGLDLLIIPGSKATAQDLQWLRESGLEQSIKQFKGQILGICGGYQMLGQQLNDPDRIESSTPVTEGIGLLPVSTVLEPAKATRLVSASPASGAATAVPAWQERIAGYEIHMGITSITGNAAPFMELTQIQDSAGSKVHTDGAVSPDGRIIGSYLHGLLDDPWLRNALLGKLRQLKGLPQPVISQSQTNPYERLADHLAEHLDLTRVWSICGLQ